MILFAIQFLYWFSLAQIVVMTLKHFMVGYTLLEKKYIILAIGMAGIPLSVLFITHHLTTSLMPYRYKNNGITTEICIIAVMVSIIASIYLTKKLIDKLYSKFNNENN